MKDGSLAKRNKNVVLEAGNRIPLRKSSVSQYSVGGKKERKRKLKTCPGRWRSGNDLALPTVVE